MCSPLEGFLLIFLLKATRDKRRFRFHLRGVQFVSAVCCTPRRSSQRYDAHREDRFHGVQHTAEIVSAVGWTPRRTLCDRTWRNRNRWVGIMKKKNRGRKSRDTLPLILNHSRLSLHFLCELTPMALLATKY